MPNRHDRKLRERVAVTACQCLLTGAIFLLLLNDAFAQNVPLISGGLDFLSSTNKGSTNFQQVITPVVAAPLGEHLLAEARFDFRGLFQQTNDTGPYHAMFFSSIDYLQLDAIVAPRMTITAGRFLIPFGTYNERLTPAWIRKFQDTPIIYPIGTRTSGSSDGVMVRGVATSSGSYQVNYVGFFSAHSGVTKFGAARSAGGRAEVYFPTKRLEIGTSYSRFLEGQHYNSTGVHVWWEPQRMPLQIRSEYAHGQHSQGYWVEAAYRLSRMNGFHRWIAGLEPLFRIQQSFRSSPNTGGQGDGLPPVDTQQADFGLLYTFPHEIRLAGSYSRQFSANGNGNIWDISLTYRFLFPMWRGH
jgi:hypothetical protein